ncbi:MAG: hypothetical protein ACI4SP_05060, partial [Eubacteriales bacterium]
MRRCRTHPSPCAVAAPHPSSSRIDPPREDFSHGSSRSPIHQVKGMLFNKYLNRYYLKYAWLYLIGIAALL